MKFTGEGDLKFVIRYNIKNTSLIKSTCVHLKFTQYVSITSQ